MKIYGIQKLTLLDYPKKTACTLFTSGCNFRCPFCHNASLVLNKAEPIPNEEIFSFLNKRTGLLDGVCITGGEPLTRPDIADFIKKVRELGFSIKLDTNGSFPDKLIALAESGLIDYVAMDVKSSPEGYAKAVGIENFDVSPIDKSIKYLLSGNIDYEFRTTAVKGLHVAEDFIKIGEWIKGASKYYIQNYRESEDILSPSSLSSFNESELKNIKKQLSGAVQTVDIRGI